MQQTILLVEDEAPNRNAVKRVLRPGGLRFLEAENGQDALQLLAMEPTDLILLDLMMPVMDGYQFLEHFRKDEATRSIPVCVMTACMDGNARRKAIDLGADDFVGKPVENTELETRVKSLLRIRDYQQRLNDFNMQLEVKVTERTLALQETLDELEASKRSTLQAYREMVLRLTSAAELKDRDSTVHMQRMSHYAVMLAWKCGWPEKDITLLLDAAMMHDIGKIGIPDTILRKGDKLSDEEFEIIKQHSVIGATILAGSTSKLLQMAEQIALCHHEHFDGSGYPNGLAGTDIPEVARIVAIADTFDALMSKRPYKDPWPLEQACECMQQRSGTHFDPDLLALFLEDQEALAEIHRQYPD